MVNAISPRPAEIQTRRIDPRNRVPALYSLSPTVIVRPGDRMWHRVRGERVISIMTAEQAYAVWAGTQPEHDALMENLRIAAIVAAGDQYGVW